MTLRLYFPKTGYLKLINTQKNVISSILLKTGISRHYLVQLVSNKLGEQPLNSFISEEYLMKAALYWP